MKRFSRWSVFAAVPLVLLSLSAGAGSAPAGKAKPLKPVALVTESAPIRAFAQDEVTIAWINRAYQVRERNLSTRASAVLGSAGPAVNGVNWNPVLALAGSHALWNTFPSGGNSVENGLLTAAPLDPRATGLDVFRVPQESSGGDFLAGIAGDGPTLVYARTGEACDQINDTCHRLDAIGGVVFVTGQYEAPTIPGIPAAAMLAFAAHDPQSSMGISQGMIAVVPAATPVVSDFRNVPRAAPNGPVEVFRVLGPQPVVHSMGSFAPVGTVRAIALDFKQLAVLVERSDGTRVLERYAPNWQGGAVIGTTAVPRGTAPGLSVSKAGIVYRVGKSIYLLGPGKPKLVWKASGTPIGLSIEGKRIAWAENVKGRGRIVALTLR